MTEDFSGLNKAYDINEPIEPKLYYGEIPELYIAWRRLAVNLGVDCKNENLGIIDKALCKMSQPTYPMIKRFYKQENIDKWEKIIKEHPELLKK